MRISDWSSDVCSSDLADRLFDRDGRVDAVLIEKVDRVDAEPLERAFAGAPRVGGRAVDAGDLLALEPEAELGRDDQPIALAPDRFAEQFLVAERRSEEHTSELQSLMRISYAVFCLKKKNTNKNYTNTTISSDRFNTNNTKHTTNYHTTEQYT